MGWDGYCKLRDNYDLTLEQIQQWQKQNKIHFIQKKDIGTTLLQNFRHDFLDDAGAPARGYKTRKGYQDTFCDANLPELLGTLCDNTQPTTERNPKFIDEIDIRSIETIQQTKSKIQDWMTPNQIMADILTGWCSRGVEFEAVKGCILTFLWMTLREQYDSYYIGYGFFSNITHKISAEHNWLQKQYERRKKSNLLLPIINDFVPYYLEIVGLTLSQLNPPPQSAGRPPQKNINRLVFELIDVFPHGNKRANRFEVVKLLNHWQLFGGNSGLQLTESDDATLDRAVAEKYEQGAREADSLTNMLGPENRGLMRMAELENWQIRAKVRGQYNKTNDGLPKIIQNNDDHAM